MTLDKIKHYMDHSIYEYWISSIPRQEDINKAFKDLKKEIDNSTITSINHIAELNLLKTLKK